MGLVDRVLKIGVLLTEVKSATEREIEAFVTFIVKVLG
jgi:hypothetical protein